MRTAPPRRLAALVGAAVAVGVVLLAAGPAWAHAELVGSTPADNAVVADSPPAVVLRFTEDVETALGSIRLFDAGGRAVDVGPGRHPEGARAVVEVAAPALAPGSYLVAWRVTSADGHPIEGSFLFSVGQPSAVSADAAALARGGGDRLVGVLLGVARWVVFAGFVLLAGGLAFVGLFRRVAPRTTVVIGAGAVLLVAGSLASIALQGGYASGTSLGRALRPSVWRDTVQTAFGRQALLRTALGTVGGALALVPARAGRAWWRAAALAVGPLAAATIAYSGHAHTGDRPALGVALDVTHLVAMAWWLGGLAVVAATAVRASDGREALGRFSPLALGCVAAVVASGAAQSWRQVGSLDALRTTYGRLLLAKLAAVVALVVAAGLTRRSMHRWTADLRPPSILRRAVLGELGFGVVVLGVTAGLVATPPARDQVARPVSVTLVDRLGATANIVVDPARVGATVVHVYVTPAGGSLQRAAEARLQLALPAANVTDLVVPLDGAGPNHFSGSSIRFPFAGRWQVTLTVRFGDFDASTFSTTLTIR